MARDTHSGAALLEAQVSARDAALLSSRDSES
jgi:hypothetical protein